MAAPHCLYWTLIGCRLLRSLMNRRLLWSWMIRQLLRSKEWSAAAVSHICLGFVRFLPMRTVKKAFQSRPNLPLFLNRTPNRWPPATPSPSEMSSTATLTGDSTTSLLFPIIPSRTLISQHNFLMFGRASSSNPYIPKCRIGSVFYSAEKLWTIWYFACRYSTCW